MTETTPVANALTDLIDTARIRADVAADHDMPHLAEGLTAISQTLDRARTRLIADGLAYLEVAFAFIDAGRTILANYRVQADAIMRARAEAAEA